MKKLLATLLIFCAWPVWAEWLPVTHVLEDGTQHFIDPSTIKGTHTKKFWIYTNNGNQSKIEGKSTRDFMEIRCDDDEYRLIQSNDFAGKDLTGSLISSYDNLIDWGPIPPGSLIAHFQTLVCGKK
jgi:hypothetical protein